VSLLVVLAILWRLDCDCGGYQVELVAYDRSLGGMTNPKEGLEGG